MCELESRVQNLSGLKGLAGVTYTFWKHANKAVKKSGNAGKVNWRDVENMTIKESIGTHGQSPEDVANRLCEISPGSITAGQQAELRKEIHKLAPGLEAQYVKKQKKNK